MVSKNNPLRDKRHPEKYFPFVDFVRRPTSADIRHPKTGAIYSTPYFWRVKNHPDGTAPSTGVEGELWYLVDITANVANWIIIGGASTQPIDSIDVDFNTAPGTDPVLPDIAGLVSIYGNTVTNATNANAPVATHSRAANQTHIDVQLAAAVAATPADPYDVGLASFNDAHFSVDANGFVSLKGGGLAVDTLTGDDATAVGPDGAGNLNFTGETVANATNVKPLYIDGDAGSNTLNAEIQVAAAITGAPGDKLDAGICSFDDTQFTVDADGYVQLAGGGLAIDTLTGDDATAVGPDGSGNLNFTGEAVANATNAKPLYFDGDAGSNTLNAEIQVATAIGAAPGDKLDAGICSFDSANFSVDSNGFVELSNPAIIPNVTNLGISYSAGTFTVNSADGSALSSSNPAYIIFSDSSTPGLVETFEVTANQSFQDAAGTSDITDNLFGFTTGIGTGSIDIPFFLYACTDGTDVTFGISKIPHHNVCPVAGKIGTPSSAIADTQSGMWLFDDVTVSNYAGKPVVRVGCFRMRMDASDDWTVQTLSNDDGIGKCFQGKQFEVPKGQYGANSGSYTVDNGGTAAVFTTETAYYFINPEGLCTYTMRLAGDGGTDGSGAVTARFVLPYIANNTIFAMPVRWKVGAGTYQTGATSDAGGGTSNFFDFTALSSGVSITWAAFVNGDRRFDVWGSYPTIRDY